MDKILILGAGGQIGLELTEALNQKYGADNILTSDIKEKDVLSKLPNEYVKIDVTDQKTLKDVIQANKISQVYHLAAVLSATAEKKPKLAWDVNIGSLLGLLEIARDLELDKIYWPSTIAVFGESTPTLNTPQHTITEPSTVYGMAKYAGELWCKYYYQNYGVDVRSLRYPGIISWKTQPGGGTTDYAVDIYHEAIQSEEFTCYLSPDRTLPMMYMDDAIRATLELMDADRSQLSLNMAYNISAMSFSPQEIAQEIKRIIPTFKIKYKTDYRDDIASTWPQSIDDSQAQKDWNWSPNYTLKSMTETMMHHLNKKELSE